MKYTIYLGGLLLLSGCASEGKPALCPAMRGWDKSFQQEMAAEVRGHWQDCPALVESAVQLVELHRACGVQ
ncbi:hypothetical protein [Neokomagataea anthophila]|uniref:Uncharacterized protein n=1 Tax=Neokomagataea anthophila TaxID=2826925 RepID=A0ABS5E4Z5_9PROT|nr:hypothetical protein [Neokomagataea anthophila]MBR0558977.1 hypothetical protein [Neokomagataea anthophila]